MSNEHDEYRMTADTLRILLPGRTGTVEIDTTLSRADGAPRIRVDVASDADRYGPADDGLAYTVTNGDPGPGVVFLTGQRTGPVSNLYDDDDDDEGCPGHGPRVTYCDGTCITDEPTDADEEPGVIR